MFEFLLYVLGGVLMLAFFAWAGWLLALIDYVPEDNNDTR